MNLRVLAVLMLIHIVVWVALTSCTYFILSEETLLMKSSMSALFFVIPGTFLWLGYTAYLMNRIVPKVDEIIDPELVESLKLRGDDWFFKCHRLILYGLSSISRRLNQRDFAHYDFDHLESGLRIPLRVHQYWMWTSTVAMVLGYVFMKLAE